MVEKNAQGIVETKYDFGKEQHVFGVGAIGNAYNMRLMF